MTIYITAKRLNDDGVLTHFKGYELSYSKTKNCEKTEIIYSKLDLIKAMESDIRIVTKYYNKNTNNYSYQNVSLVTISENDKYIRSNRNDIERDNLYNLPDF